MLKKSLVLLIVFLPFAASAASVHLGDYFLKGSEEVPDDLYVIGEYAAFTGAAREDVVGIGRTLISSGTTGGDALFIGEEVTLGGAVGDDVRVVGSRITIGGLVSDDVVAVGSKVVIQPTARIEGSLYVVGGSVELHGVVLENVKIVSGNASVSGTVDKDLEVWGRVSFSLPSRVGGDFIHHGKEGIVPPVNVEIVGDTILDVAQENALELPRHMFSGGFFSIKALMMLAFGFALFFLARERVEEVLLDTLAHFPMRILRGILIIILLALAGALALGTIVGIPVALALGALFVLLLLCSWTYAGIVVGAWFERVFFKRSPFPLSYRPVLLGILALSLLSFVPFIGVLVHTVLLCAGAGSLGTIFYRHLRMTP